jgi:hypothetical protein
MTRAKARDGTHWPPCATNREVASTTVWLLSSSNTAKTGATADSTRANCCLSNLLGSMWPSASKVRMENVLRTTCTGFLATSSTTTLAIRARCPAKTGRQWLAGSRSIRSNLVLDSRQRVSSRAIRNLRQKKPMVLPLALTVMCTTPGEIPQRASPAGDSPLDLTPRAAPGFVSSRWMPGSAVSFLHVKHVAVIALVESNSVARRSRLRGTTPRAWPRPTEDHARPSRPEGVLR